MTYHDVEKNHGAEHICDKPNFKPKKPYIHVSIIKDLNGDFKIDWDVQSCSSFSKEYAIALIEKSRLNKSISMEVEI